jgi:hypothetical protein
VILHQLAPRCARTAIALAWVAGIGLPLEIRPGALAGAAAVQRPFAEGQALFLPAVLQGSELPGGPMTLILTDVGAVARHFRLDPESAELRAWQSQLEALARDPAVDGWLVTDLERQAGEAVRMAHVAWQAQEDPTQMNRKANNLARALRDWIWHDLRARMPQLRTIVIAGDDRIVPFFRLKIEPPPPDQVEEWQKWDSETDYFDETGLVGAGTTVGAALAADLTLTDDFYGAAEVVRWPAVAEELPLPALPVGRLVERPSQMTAAIAPFLAAPERPLRRSLLAAYDFMQDGVEAAEPALAQVLPPEQRTRLIGSDWTAGELKGALFGPRPDLFYFGLHANHFNAETPNNGILTAEEVATSGADLRGILAFGLACHAGLNVPGDAHPAPMDFPEAWLGHGATYLGSTGWAYGGDRREPALRYQEALMSKFAALLLKEEGASVGDALVKAKRDYLRGVEAPNPFHAKTLVGTTLYGLPMARIRLADP